MKFINVPCDPPPPPHTTTPHPRPLLTVRTKRTLHSSRQLSFNDLTNAKKKILCCTVAILLSTDAAARLRARRAH